MRSVVRAQSRMQTRRDVETEGWVPQAVGHWLSFLKLSFFGGCNDVSQKKGIWGYFRVADRSRPRLPAGGGVEAAPPAWLSRCPLPTDGADPHRPHPPGLRQCAAHGPARPRGDALHRRRRPLLGRSLRECRGHLGALPRLTSPHCGQPPTTFSWAQPSLGGGWAGA